MEADTSDQLDSDSKQSVSRRASLSVVDLLDSDSDASLTIKKIGESSSPTKPPQDKKRSNSIIEVHGSESEDATQSQPYKRQKVIAHTSDYTQRIRQKRYLARALKSSGRKYSTSSSSESDDNVQADEPSDDFDASENFVCSDFEEGNVDEEDDQYTLIIATPDNIVQSITGYSETVKNSDVIDIDDNDDVKLLINSDLMSETTVDKIKQHWTDNNALQMENFDMITDPFKLCTVADFVANEKVLTEIRKCMQRVAWQQRSLDLYEFFQTVDLSYMDNLTFLNVSEFLHQQVMPWVSKITGLNLHRVSVSCSCYTFTDFLLVHDDLREDRFIAFILYLDDPSDPWKEEYGGALQLFSRDDSGQPALTVREIYPRNNQFVFFPVTKNSYHQVDAIKSMNRSRLTINGWFHMKEINDDAPPAYITPKTGLFGPECIHACETDAKVIEKFVSPIYLDLSVNEGLQRYFEEQSQACLENYFVEDSLAEVGVGLSQDDVKWEWSGPPNRRWYEVADVSTLPVSVTEFITLFKSDKFFDLLSRHSGLEFTNENQSSFRYEFQRWSEGCYSLMSEASWYREKELDVIVYFGIDNDRSNVGEALYVERTMDGTQTSLINIATKANTLNLVYREENTARIVRRIPPKSHAKAFYMLVCSYKE